MRPYIPFLAFLVLLVLTIPFSSDFATSVIPGWHTTIFSPYFIWQLIIIFLLLLSTIGYWLLSKRIDKINWRLFAFHFILTIPMLTFLKFPTIFLNIDQTYQEKIIKVISLQRKLIPLVWTLFIIGQVLFVIYFIRITNSKHVTT
jgi:hypothetical protein